jgi:hypothetical protein
MRNRKYGFVVTVSLLCVALSLISCATKDVSVDKNSSSDSDVSKAKPQQSFPEPPSWSFPEVIESARKISPKNAEGRTFNQFGLAYSTTELTRLSVAKMSAEKLQNYADIVTYAYPDAVFRQAPESCKDMSLTEINETSVANIAYVSLHAINKNTRERAATCLIVIQSRLR